jgi:hypothetical protein
LEVSLPFFPAPWLPNRANNARTLKASADGRLRIVAAAKVKRRLLRSVGRVALRAANYAGN